MTGHGSRPPRVVMMCGVAGSGKTTYAKRLESEGFARLSIDEYIWSTYGRFGIDYPESTYIQYQASTENALQVRLVQLIAQCRDVVLDISFWQRARRDRYKAIIEDAGGTWNLCTSKHQLLSCVDVSHSVDHASMPMQHFRSLRRPSNDSSPDLRNPLVKEKS